MIRASFKADMFTSDAKVRVSLVDYDALIGNGANDIKTALNSKLHGR